MKKKFCLALLLIAAICLSAGVAQANPEWLAGTWRLGNGGGELNIKVGDGDPVEKPVTAGGTARFTISNVVGDGSNGTLDFSGEGNLILSATIDDVPRSLPIPMSDFSDEGKTFTNDENEYTMTFGDLDDVTLKITVTSGTKANVIIDFTDVVIAELEDQPVKVTGELEFDNVTKVPSSDRSSSSGGCDTGAGFGLFLALGALAVFKRAKRKA